MNRIYAVLLMLLCALQLCAQPSVFISKGVGGGGALFFPRINPANDNEFYVACDMSEMFHSTDYGNSYSEIHFTKLPAMNVSTYEFTNDSEIAYSNYNDGNNGYPVKTTDGGNTWTLLSGYDLSQGQVYAMKANYNNPSQILVNSYGGIYISNDKGATFNVVKNAANMGVGIIMGGVFFDSNKIYIGTNEGIIYSTDGGVSFHIMATTGIPSGEVIWSFAGAKSGSNTRFVCITGDNSDTYNGLMPEDYYSYAKGVYTMDNAGGTWAAASSGIDFTNDFVMYAAMAWNDINTIYLGGNDNALDADLVYKSTDGGASWNKVFKTTNNQNIQTGWSGYKGDKNWGWGETTFGITVAPYNSNKVMFGDYGFIHLTSDGGNTWKQAYVSNSDQHPANAVTPKQKTYHSIGLENTSCWQVDWQGANNMFAGFSDIGGIRSTDSGNTWGFTYSGMSVNSVYRIAKNPSGTLFVATSGIHDMYQSTRLRDAQLDAADGAGAIMYSTDNGVNWSNVHAFGHPVFWIAIDPNNADKMYASIIDYGGGGSSMKGGIYVTDDLNNLSASTWTLLPAPPRTEGHPASIIVLNDGKVLCSFSGRINSGGQFTASSGVFLYDPATLTWADVSDVNMQYWTMDVVVDANDTTQNTWYAGVFTGWGPGANNGQGGLYRTTDRGTSWTKLTDTLFTRVTSVSINPENTSQAYLTTETQGLWVSNNINAVHPSWSLVYSYPFQHPERVFFNPYNQTEMWVTSFGNGLKVGNLSTTSVPMFTNGKNTLEVFPNPATNEIYIVLPISKADDKYIRVYDQSGRLVRETPRGAGSKTLIDIHALPPGTYWISYDNKAAKIVKE
ncbi:MAG TPA: T9SS type A sorting domain-containing protein [Flavipsychrobacter sp.]|nr:T9SS type A sorting domain-containing protein [Flavipsychrobacter sp.]